VRLTVTTERQTRTIAGSLFAGTKPRIVELEGISLEAEVARNMLFRAQRRQAGLHRPAGHRAGRRRHQHRQLQTSAAGRKAAAPWRWCRSTARCRTRSSRAVLALPSVVQAKALNF